MTSEDAVRITARGPASGTEGGKATRRRGGGTGEDGLPVSAELIVFVLTSILLLIACQIADSFDARLAWTLITVLAFAYIISRGLARRDIGSSADR